MKNTTAWGVPKDAFGIPGLPMNAIRPMPGTLEDGRFRPEELLPGTEPDGPAYQAGKWNISDSEQDAWQDIRAQAREAICRCRVRIADIGNFIFTSGARNVRDDPRRLLYNGMPDDDDIGDLFDIKSFTEATGSGCIIDDDGSGDLVIDGMTYSNVMVFPSGQYVMIADQAGIGDANIPFRELEQAFPGAELAIRWYNK